MQKKIGTLLDENLLKETKQRALAEHTTLNRIFEKALSEYLFRYPGSKKVLSGVEISFGVFKMPSGVVQKIAREEIYETE